MRPGNRLMKNLLLHIKYPYTALVITVIWTGTAAIIGLQQQENFEVLIIAAAASSIIIAMVGFRPPSR